MACWGYNLHGQLEDGNVGTDSYVLRDVTHADGTPFLASSLGLGFLHSCAVRSDKTVSCWGNNYKGQLGNRE